MSLQGLILMLRDDVSKVGNVWKFNIICNLIMFIVIFVYVII